MFTNEKLQGSLLRTYLFNKLLKTEKDIEDYKNRLADEVLKMNLEDIITLRARMTNSQYLISNILDDMFTHLSQNDWYELVSKNLDVFKSNWVYRDRVKKVIEHLVKQSLYAEAERLKDLYDGFKPS